MGTGGRPNLDVRISAKERFLHNCRGYVCAIRVHGMPSGELPDKTRCLLCDLEQTQPVGVHLGLTHRLTASRSKLTNSKPVGFRQEAPYWHMSTTWYCACGKLMMRRISGSKNNRLVAGFSHTHGVLLLV